MTENTPRKSPSILLVGLALGGAVIAAYFALRSPGPVAPPPAAPVTKAEPAAPQDAPLPAPEQRDTTVRGQLAEVSPGLAQYLNQKDLLERWVQVANSLRRIAAPASRSPFC